MVGRGVVSFISHCCALYVTGGFGHSNVCPRSFSCREKCTSRGCTGIGLLRSCFDVFRPGASTVHHVTTGSLAHGRFARHAALIRGRIKFPGKSVTPFSSAATKCDSGQASAGSCLLPTCCRTVLKTNANSRRVRSGVKTGSGTGRINGDIVSVALCTGKRRRVNSVHCSQLPKHSCAGDIATRGLITISRRLARCFASTHRILNGDNRMFAGNCFALFRPKVSKITTARICDGAVHPKGMRHCRHVRILGAVSPSHPCLLSLFIIGKKAGRSCLLRNSARCSRAARADLSVAGVGDRCPLLPAKMACGSPIMRNSGAG